MSPLFVDEIVIDKHITRGMVRTNGLVVLNWQAIYPADEIEATVDSIINSPSGKGSFLDRHCQFIVRTNIDAKPEMTLTMEVLDCNNNIDAALEEYVYLQTIGPDLGDKFMKLFEEIRADDKIIETTMLVNPF